MTPLNESQYRRRRYIDEFAGTSDGTSPGASTYDEFMPDGARSPDNGQRRTPEAFSRAKDTVQRGFSGAQRYITSHDVEDVVEDARNVARRNPRIAIVALVAVGFVIGRLLRRPR